MRKEQEAEAARRVAEERRKREVNEKKLQATPVVEKKAREPSPAAVEEIKPVEPTVTKDEDNGDRMMDDTNVSSLLRQRLATTPPPTPDREEEEWNEDKNFTNEPPAQPEPTITSDDQIEASEETAVDEGLRCIALYGYDKGE